MNEVRLPQGTIRYRESGAGDPIVFVHGLLVNGGLWREVTPLLAKDFRVIAPDWPLGSHEVPLQPGADLTPTGLAALVAGFLEALELDRVTLVGNDTGGAICQLVAVNHPERLGGLVLTPCDAYEHFPPPAFAPLFALGSVPGAVSVLANAMRPRSLRRSPLAYGWLTKARIDDALLDEWLQPALASRAVRRDARAVMRGVSKRYTLEAAKRFPAFDKPVLIAWAPEDRFFKLRNAERLAADFPNARLELIEDSYTFVSLDQPTRTAELIAAFAREPVAAS
jgi:pimeloyl-ACP methyl ester carboxylesterase